MFIARRWLIALSSLALPIAFGSSGCSARPASPSTSVEQVPAPAPAPLVAIPTSPQTYAAQGVAIDGVRAAYVSSNYWMTAYDASWKQEWTNTNTLAGLPPTQNHMSDVEYYDGRLIVPILNWQGNCVDFKPVTIAVYDATNGALLTWSDISVDGVSGTSLAVIPEKKQVVVASFCPLAQGFSTLWVYDLNAVLNNPAGTAIKAISTLHLTTTIPYIQGISWNSNLQQFLASSYLGGPGGSLWYIAADGTVSGPAYVPTVSQTVEIEGVDFTTSNVYYLEFGYVTNLGAPPTAPVFSLQAGTYSSAQSVSIASSTPDAAIHYTTDGSLPGQSSPLYSAPINISATEKLCAVATNSIGLSSPMTTADYFIH